MTATPLRLNACVVDLARQLLERGGEVTPLRTKEALAHLTANPRRVITRDELLVEVWVQRAQPFAHSRAVDVRRVVVTPQVDVEDPPERDPSRGRPRR